MRQHIPAILAGLIAGAIPGGYALWHKPEPVIVQPQTNIVARAPASNGPTSGSKVVEVPCVITTPGAPAGTTCSMAVPDSTPTLTRAEQRQLAASWGDLDQKEIDVLSEALKALPKTQLVIFCENDALCGDMQLDFDNAFETAHWDTRLEKPLTDDTIGIGTSREDLRAAIAAATNGRLPVKIIQKNAPFDVLTIGKKVPAR